METILFRKWGVRRGLCWLAGIIVCSAPCSISTGFSKLSHKESSISATVQHSKPFFASIISTQPESVAVLYFPCFSWVVVAVRLSLEWEECCWLINFLISPLITLRAQICQNGYDTHCEDSGLWNVEIFQIQMLLYLSCETIQFEIWKCRKLLILYWMIEYICRFNHSRYKINVDNKSEFEKKNNQKI